MEALRLSDAQTNLHVGTSIACSPSSAAEQVLLYCVEGEAKASPICHSERGAAESKNPYSPSPTLTLAPGEALLLADPASLTLTGPAALMLCRIQPSPLGEGGIGRLTEAR